MAASLRVQRKRKIKRPDSGPLRSLLWVLFLFFILWSAIAWGKQVLQQERVETVVAQEGVVEVTTEATGFLFLEERVLSAPADGIFRPLVMEGERVPAGMTVAEIVVIPDLDKTAAELAQVQEQLDQLIREGDEKTAELRELLRVKTDQVVTAVRQLKDALAAGEPLTGAALREELEELLQERQNLLAELARQRHLSLEAREKWLKEQEELEGLVQAALVPIQAPVAGIVSFSLFGNEGQFSPRRAMEVEAEELVDLPPEEPQLMAAGQKVKAGQPLLRVVDNFTVYLGVVLPHEELEALTGMSRVTIRLPEFDYWEQTCPVVHISGEGETGLLVLELAEYRPELLRYRSVTVEVVRERYRGLVIPREAILRRDGEDGVYIVRGEGVVFQPVEIAGGNEEAVAVVGGISLYQEVVTNPQWVREGQRVK